MQALPYDDLPTDGDAIFQQILSTGATGGDLVRLYHQLRAAAPIFRADFPRLHGPLRLFPPFLSLCFPLGRA